MNDDNFGLKDVIKYYKKQGYIFYNLSKLKTFKDYIDFEKYKRKNQNKLITYLKISSIYNKNTTRFYKRLIKTLIKYYSYKYLNYKINFPINTIIFFYNDKFVFNNKKYFGHNNKLLDIIQNILFNENFKCDVCFNDEHKLINICKQCNFQTCNTCKKRLKKISNKCCCCKC